MYPEKVRQRESVPYRVFLNFCFCRLTNDIRFSRTRIYSIGFSSSVRHPDVQFDRKSAELGAV